MNREQVYYVLFEQQKDFWKREEFVSREITPSIIQFIRLKLPIIITGVRRSGKSTLLKIIARERALNEKNVLYINFNDERLINFAPDDFQKILDYLNETEYREHCFLFIDEIQEVEKWEKWVDRIKEKHTIIITGSNSKLLSKEISTVLTGRSINVNLYPFSFRELIASKGIKTKDAYIDLTLQSLLRKECAAFLAYGGIPKFVIEKDKTILTELYENILYRDIIKRFPPSLEKPIKEISLAILSSVAKETSIRSLSALSGITNLMTMKSVIDAFEGAFLFSFVQKFDYSVKKQIQNPRKAYCVDNGFVSAVSFRFSEDNGKLLENAVFNELKRRNKEVYYFAEKKECDFVVREGIKVKEVIQVAFTFNDENREREIGGLVEAMDFFKLRQGIVITSDQEEELIIGGKKIYVIPVWKWLLTDEKTMRTHR